MDGCWCTGRGGMGSWSSAAQQSSSTQCTHPAWGVLPFYCITHGREAHSLGDRGAPQPGGSRLSGRHFVEVDGMAGKRLQQQRLLAWCGRGRQRQREGERGRAPAGGRATRGDQGRRPDAKAARRRVPSLGRLPACCLQAASIGSGGRER